MGEEQGTLFSPDFNRSIQVEARADRLSSDAGVLLMRELMDRLGYPGLLVKHLRDPRERHRVTHPFVELVRTAILLLVQGFEDHTDATLQRNDPLFRLAVSERRGERPLREGGRCEPEGLCSQATLSRLTAALAAEGNRDGLERAMFEASLYRMGLSSSRKLAETTVDLDSLPAEVFGAQPGSAWNGHYRACCYHPLVARSDSGDFLGAILREGNVHTADGGCAFVLPILRALARFADRVWPRIDAGFPEPELLAALETESFRYVARLKTNAALERLAAPLLAQPAEGAPREGRIRTHELTYRAGSWDRDRRVVLVAIERTDDQMQLFLDHFFLLTNVGAEEMAGPELLEHYRKRGTAEKDFGDWNQALTLSLSSSPRPKSHYRGKAVREAYETTDCFGANEARLLLSLIAANLMHAAAAILDGEVTARMGRERFRQLILRSAGRVLLHGRRIRVVIEEARAPLWVRFLRNLEELHPPRGSPGLAAPPIPA